MKATTKHWIQEPLRLLSVLGSIRPRRSHIGIVTVLYAVLVVALATQTSQLLTANNAQVIATEVATLGIVTIGQAIALISGGFDLSISGVVPLAAVLYTQFSNSGIPVVAAFALTLAVGATAGLFNGLVVTKLRVNPLIATLGTMSIAEGLAFIVSAGNSPPLVDPSAGFIDNPTALGVPIFVPVFVGVAVLVAMILRWTVPGRALYAVGGAPEAARLAGMRVDLVRTLAFITSALLASLAGIVLASELLAGSPNVGSDLTLTSITAAVLGGTSLFGGVGTIGGAMIGVLILGTLDDALDLLQISTFYQQVTTGGVLLVAMTISELRLPAWCRRFGVRRGTPNGDSPAPVTARVSAGVGAARERERAS